MIQVAMQDFDLFLEFRRAAEPLTFWELGQYAQECLNR